MSAAEMIGINADAAAMRRAAQYGEMYRQRPNPIHPTADASSLRGAFVEPLPEFGVDGVDVINALIEGAEPGLVGNTDPNFYAWVMGASDPVGVAADWLTSAWGQNAAIYQTSPSAAIAEEAVSDWILELLDLPRDSSIGFVTGATMATFVGLAAARSKVLERAGHDFEQYGLQGGPIVKIFVSDDIHASNLAAVRYLGFGEANMVRVPSDDGGLMIVDELRARMEIETGPKIIIATAGHINSGGFEDFEAISKLSRQHDAWLHIDGAFGLWARVLPEKDHLTKGIELADSWSVDGHKWLQLPYECGFAIVRDSDAHRKAMDISAGYLNRSPGEGRNPTEYNPELSRRARGFVAWAVLKHLGRKGVEDCVRRHCEAAEMLARRVDEIDHLKIVNTVDLNQIVIGPSDDLTPEEQARFMSRLFSEINENAGVFLREVNWKERVYGRVSIVSQHTSRLEIANLATALERAVNVIMARVL